MKSIILQGAGRSFCGGFNFSGGFHQWDNAIASDDQWDAGKDMVMATHHQLGWVPRYMSLWRSPKPVIAQVPGWCVGGGSKLALCADIVTASEDAQIGTPHSRMWGCHHAGMWVHCLGLAKAKELALTGRSLSGTVRRHRHRCVASTSAGRRINALRYAELCIATRCCRSYCGSGIRQADIENGQWPGVWWILPAEVIAS